MSLKKWRPRVKFRERFIDYYNRKISLEIFNADLFVVLNFYIRRDVIKSELEKQPDIPEPINETIIRF